MVTFGYFLVHRTSPNRVEKKVHLIPRNISFCIICHEINRRYTHDAAIMQNKWVSCCKKILQPSLKKYLKL